MMSKTLRIAGGLLVLFATACGSAGFGATPGGIQDMQFARELVEQGHVPPAEAFLVEGMFSEHDLPVDGGQCGDLLCTGAATAVAPNRAGAVTSWVQIGLSSTIDPDQFERDPLAAVFVIDESGSMGYGYKGTSSPGKIAKKLGHSIVDQLDSNDRVAIVTFGSRAHRRMGWKTATNNRVRNEINQLKSRGSTNMEAGMKMGIDLARNAPPGRAVRIFLITDAHPNVGTTGGTEFANLVSDAARDGIGTTVFGAGLGLGIELTDFIAANRGGNAFTLQHVDRVDRFMENNWPWLMSPIAYDLALAADANEATTIRASYGFPGTEPGTPALLVNTVFLSKNRGALLLELGGEPEQSGVTINLSYEDLDGEVRDTQLVTEYSGRGIESTDQDGEYWSQPGIHKTVSLALLVTSMRDAATLYGGSHEDAIAELTVGLNRFIDESYEIDDPSITAEAEFWPKLLELMEQGAPQGSYYPGEF